MYKLTKNFRFESAHRLAKGYEGKCANIHGHSWNGTLILETAVLDTKDISVDFYQMGKFCKSMEECFDHKIILCESDTDIIELCRKNNYAMVLLPDNPTCEAIAKYIYERALLHFTEPIKVKSVEIKETCTTSCTYTL